MGGGSQETAASPSVLDLSTIQTLDNIIFVLDGTNLRQLRDGLCLCAPGIVEPAKRQRKTFWEAITKLLLEVCDRNILTSEKIRSPHLLNLIRGNFLEKGCGN